MVDSSTLTVHDILDWIAWKAAFLCGWDVETTKWRIGIKRLGEFTRLIVCSPASHNVQLEVQKDADLDLAELGSGKACQWTSFCAGSGTEEFDIITEHTSSEKVWLTSILNASRHAPVWIHGETSGSRLEILPAGASLEWILLQLDIIGWTPPRLKSAEVKEKRL